MGQTKKSGRKYRSLYLRVAFVVIGAIFVLMLAFSFLIRTAFVRMIENDYSRRMAEINEVFIHQIDRDEIEKYLNSYEKDEYYYEMLTSLYKMKSIFQLDAIYIVAKDGDVYRYIFNGVIGDDYVYDDSSFGLPAKNLLPGADEVLEGGAPFEELRYFEDEQRGGAYYLYSPVVNSRGNVIAVFGLEINAQYLNRLVFDFEWQLLFSCLFVFALLFMFIMWYCKTALSRPLLYMSADIEKLAAGELGGELDRRLLKRKDEFGLIYKALADVNSVLNNFFKSMNTVAKEVLHGKLSARMYDKDIYRGNYHEFLLSTNRMLENNQRLLDMMPSAAYFYDSDFNVIYRNELAGDEDGFMVATIGAAFDENYRAVKKLLRDFTNGGEERASGTINFQNDNGDVRYYEYFLIWLAEERSEIYAIYSDVTEYIDMSKKAEASSRSKSEFLSRMSHELRTPMNSIIGMTQLARRDTDNEKMERSLSTIEDSAAHLLTIINDVLDISKIEYGNMELSLAPFDLSRLLGDVLRILEVQAREKDIRLRIDVEGFEDSSPHLLGDESRLRQVIINLISNAVKFSPQGEEVTLELYELPPKKMNGTRFRLSVIDHGIGIAPEYRQKIFESFEQGSGDISRRFGGTGLGLPISNRIIGLMNEGAGIQVRSEIGKGSTFFFELELENADGELPLIPEEHIAAELDLNERRILLVDDIEINRDIVAAMLSDSGALIEEADDGEAALDLFKNSAEGYYALILIDIRMKKMDGDAATRAIRALDRPDAGTVKIIGMSANAFQSDVELALESGMNSYITKPINYNNMVNTILKTMNTSQQEHVHARQ